MPGTHARALKQSQPPCLRVVWRGFYLSLGGDAWRAAGAEMNRHSSGESSPRSILYRI